MPAMFVSFLLLVDFDWARTLLASIYMFGLVLLSGVVREKA